jgi:hypothetical protein
MSTIFIESRIGKTIYGLHKKRGRPRLYIRLQFDKVKAYWDLSKMCIITEIIKQLFPYPKIKKSIAYSYCSWNIIVRGIIMIA